MFKTIIPLCPFWFVSVINREAEIFTTKILAYFNLSFFLIVRKSFYYFSKISRQPCFKEVWMRRQSHCDMFAKPLAWCIKSALNLLMKKDHHNKFILYIFTLANSESILVMKVESCLLFNTRCVLQYITAVVYLVTWQNKLSHSSHLLSNTLRILV